MSLQAELCVQVLMRLYIELDQRTGWTDPGKLAKYFEKNGIGLGRTNEALRTLKSIQMVEDNPDKTAIKLSPYGLDWFEKCLPLTSREPDYEFSLPMFRSIKLVGPDEFYKRKSSSPKKQSGDINWTKWSVLVALLVGVFSIAIMKGWL